MLERLERRFGVRSRGSSLRTEAVAGITTYMALAYIVLVNPAVLAGTGMDAGAVMMATCLSAALATAWMALHANYPIALAPAMGHNFFFATTVCGPVAVGGLGYSLAGRTSGGIRFGMCLPPGLVLGNAVSGSSNKWAPFRSKSDQDVSRGPWKKNSALHSVIRVSDQAATCACSRTSIRRW